MSLLYRGIWQDDRDDLCLVATESFRSWVASKGMALHIPDEGVVECSHEHGTAEVVVRRALAAGVDAVQFELVEDRPDHAERWTTRLTALEGEKGDRWVWVDLERVADDMSSRPPLAAPRLVRDLIESGLDVRVDQVRLLTNAHTISAGGLHGLIRNGNRTLPLVVFSVDPHGGDTPTIRRADTTAQRLAGAVQVMILPTQHMAEFNDRVDDGLGVWGGAARVYLPNSGAGGLRPERHRYISLAQMGDDPRRPAQILSNMISSTVTARRPPALYERVRRELRLGRNRSDAELLVVAEEEIERLTKERNELKDDREAIEYELLDTQADLEDAVGQVTRLQNQLQVMLVGERDDNIAEKTQSLTCEPQNIAEALGFARSRLTGLVIPEGIERDLDVLDSHMNAVSWGQRVWQGLRALHVYADSGFDGGFWQWCSRSGHNWAWPATDKKLAMRESRTVESSPRLSEQRRFPIDERIDASGFVIMWSHLKIAEGGGPLAPRVYFHDDSRGETGRVHIGFIGPHRHTENTRTN